jgi:hypothetical protein
VPEVVGAESVEYDSRRLAQRYADDAAQEMTTRAFRAMLRPWPNLGPEIAETSDMVANKIDDMADLVVLDEPGRALLRRGV